MPAEVDMVSSYHQPGDFFTVTGGRRPSELLIEAFTGSRYYHAGIYLGNGTVIEALGGGVTVSPLSEYNPSDLLWSSGVVDLRPAQRDAVCATARSKVGTPYSWLDIAALAASLWGLTPDIVWDRLNRSDRLICSQLVALCYASADVILVPTKSQCRVTPGDLADVITGQKVPANR